MVLGDEVAGEDLGHGGAADIARADHGHVEPVPGHDAPSL